MTSRAVGYVFGALLWVLSAGCATAPSKPFSESKVYQVPVFTPVGKETQNSGGMTIQMVGPKFELRPRTFRTCSVKGVMNQLLAGGAADKGEKPFTVQTFRSNRVFPNEAVFELKLTNRMPVGVNLGDAVFTWASGSSESPLSLYRVSEVASNPTGQDRPLDASDVRASRLLPGHTVTFHAKPFSTIPADGVITFTAYDVVTAVDAAGRPTAKGRYTWSYKITSQPTPGTASSTVEERVMTRQQAHELCRNDEEELNQRYDAQTGVRPAHQ